MIGLDEALTGVPECLREYMIAHARRVALQTFESPQSLAELPELIKSFVEGSFSSILGVLIHRFAAAPDIVDHLGPVARKAPCCTIPFSLGYKNRIDRRIPPLPNVEDPPEVFSTIRRR